MKFSVVTPCFNAMSYLPDCVTSVRHACEGLDYEHVIADGGSTDGTVDYLKEQTDVDWVSEKDSGMYEALNKAIARASGDVIGHLNTDEQYNRVGLRAAIERFDEANVDAVFGPTVMVDGKGDFIQLFKQIVVPRVVDTHWCMPVQSCSLLYRKACWERLPYDTSYRLVADHVWFRKQMEAGLQIVCSLKPIGIFTWHADNLSSTEGRGSSENALGDINTGSLRIKFAKHVYRLRKWLAGGYSPEPIEYEQMREGELIRQSVAKPTLKVRRDLRG